MSHHEEELMPSRAISRFFKLMISLSLTGWQPLGVRIASAPDAHTRYKDLTVMA